MVKMEIPKTTIVSIGRIIVDNSNPNEMSKDSFEALKKNITKYGFLVLIITNSELKIADGFHRWKAARELGMSEVPVIKLDVNEVDRRMLRQIMNKLRGDHDEEKDISEFQFIMDEGCFEEFKELLPNCNDNSLVEAMQTGEVEEDDFEEPKEAKYEVNKGDVYTLGEHRLMCGDSTVKDDVDKLMDGKKADMVFTDPPWNVNYGGNLASGKNEDRKILNDSMETDDFKDFMLSSYKSMNNACEEGAMIYVVMSAQEWGNNMLCLKDNEFHWSSTIIWVKSSLIISRKDYHTQYEPIWYGWKGEGRIYPLKDRTQSDVWNVQKASDSKLHPTMKPIELCARAINNSSITSSKILDLFGGSGSTLIACEQLNRKCFMMELDPYYCSVIIERFINLKGNDNNVWKIENGMKIPINQVQMKERENQKDTLIGE